jgi:hypothetical protein
VKSRRHAGIVIAFFALLFAGVASAQSFQTGVTYVCGSERMRIESCNTRDTSDTSTCLVQHPDRPLHNGFVAYTNETRGALNKLVPTCKQPSAADVAHAQAFAKKQTDKQDAILKQNLAAMDAPTVVPGSVSAGSVKSQRDKARLARCISAGKSEGQCAGNEFGKAFEGVFAFAGSMLGMSAPQAGIYLNGVYEGKGGWNINFQADTALVQCSDLVGRDQNYKLEFKGSQVVVHVDNKPEPLTLSYRDGKLYGSAAVQVAGDIVVGRTAGYGGGGGGSSTPQGTTSSTSTQTTSREISGMEAEAYQRGGGTGSLTPTGPGYTLSETTTTTTYSAAPAPTPTYNTGPRIITAPRTRTCAAPVLATTKTTGSGDMGNAVSGLGAMLGGEGETKRVTAPTGLRMLGEFAAPSGADIDFHDDSAIVACGLIAAQYPYTIEVNGGEPVLRLASVGKPTISLTVGADRTLTGTGDLQVTGRVAMGEDRDGNITYTSRSVSCALGTLKPVTENSTDGLATPSAVASSKVPSSPPVASASATNSTSATAAKPAGPAFAKPGAPTGNAVLTIVSGFPVQAGAPSLLGGRPYLLLRDNLETALAKGGAPVPAGVSSHRAVKEACEQKTPDCRKYLLAISADAATGLAADASGRATLPGVPPGTYFLVVSNEKSTIYWEMKLVLKSGTNTASLDQHNAVPMQ